MEEVLNFYKVNIKLASAPKVQKALMFTLPTIEPESEPIVLLQPVTDISVVLAIDVTFYMIICCKLKQCRNRSLARKLFFNNSMNKM